MITARQFKTGYVVEMNKQLYIVVSAQHIKPGKGGAFVRAKLKNLKTGATAENTYRPEESFPQAFIEKKTMQFLYKDHSMYFFMDHETYEQTAVGEELVGEVHKFLKDGMEVSVSMHKNSIVEVSLASTVKLKVTYTEPGIRGDTARASTKPATLETGAIVKVPLFINTGESIYIDTRTGEYAGRV